MNRLYKEHQKEYCKRKSSQFRLESSAHKHQPLQSNQPDLIKMLLIIEGKQVGTLLE